MKRWQRRLVIWVCMFAVLLSAGVAQANSIFDRLHIELRDVQQASWAEKEIREMVTRGIISGYTDQTFRPNQAVTKIEALAMAIRALGLEQEAVKQAGQYDAQFQMFSGKGLDWAKGYLKVAYNHGLISNYNQELNWQEPADRAWMAQLIVRMLGKEEEVLTARDYSLGFKDEQQIVPRSRAKYIAKAMNEGLLSGYPDRTFRPNAAMTRAEFSVLLSNYYKKFVEDYSLRKLEYAMIEEIDWDTSKVIIRGQRKDMLPYQVFALHPQAIVYQAEYNKPVVRTNTSSLKRGQTVNLTIHQETIIQAEITYDTDPYIYETGSAYQGNIYRAGFLESISTNQRNVTLKNLAGKKETFSLADHVEILYNGNKIHVSQLTKDSLYMYQLEGEKIVHLEYKPKEEQTFSGEVRVYSPKIHELQLRYKSEKGYGEDQWKTFYIPEGVQIGAARGDYVRVFAYGDLVYHIELIKSTDVEGFFREYDEDRHEITILDKYGKKQTFKLAPTKEMRNQQRQKGTNTSPTLNVQGSNVRSLDGLHYNDYIMLMFNMYDESPRSQLEVLSIQVLNQLDGTIEAASYSTATIRTDQGETIRFSFIDEPKVQIPGIRDARRADLRKHDKVFIRIKEGDISEIRVYERSEEEGYVLYAQDNTLHLVDRSNKRYSYQLSSSTSIKWHDFKLSRKDLITGQKIKFGLDGDLITEITLVDEGQLSGVLTDYSHNSIWLEGTGVSRERFMLDEKVRISTLKKRNASLADLLDHIVTVSFANDKAVSIMQENESETTYRVINIIPQENSIRVMDEKGKHYVYSLAENIKYHYNNYTATELGQKISPSSRVQLDVVNHQVIKIRD